jgi:hypothetical protein
MKKNIFFMITSDLFVRNYIFTNSLKEIEKHNNVYFLACDKNVTLKKEIKKKKNFLGFYHFPDQQRKRYQNFYLSVLFKKKYKSKTIRLYISRVLQLKLVYGNESIYKILFMFFLRIGSWLKRYFLFTYSKAYAYLFPKNKLLFSIEDNSKLDFLFKFYKPSLVIIPTGGDDIGYWYVTNICKKNNIKSLAIVDNWDNFSSRPHLDPKPDFYAAWSEQSKMHAKKFHNISSRKVFIIGSARHDNYFSVRKENLKSYFNFNYILFFESFGITEGLEELFDILDNILERQKKLYGNLKLIYRPHPWQKKFKPIQIKKYKNIILDPQLKKNYEKNISSTSFQPDLSYYPALIKNAEFIISSPTTMLIESLIFRKKILLLAYDKNKKFGNYDYIKNVEHFKNIEKNPAILICKNIKNLKNDFFKIYNKKNYSLEKKIDNHRNYYLHYDKNQPYKNRLNKIVQNLNLEND